MTPIEFLYKLKQLPPDTPLSIAHMGAAFEMLSAVLVRSSSSDTKISLSAKLTNEAALANWLGEPVTILQSWRIKYVGASPIRYRLGFVCEWIVNHIIPILSQPMPDGSTLASNSAEIAAQWKSHIPAMIVDEKLIGFFRSVDEDTEPTDYELLDFDAIAFQPSRMTRENLENIPLSLDAQGKFSAEVATSVSHAREIYLAWKDKAMPEILLQFFRSALAHDDNLALEIAKDLDAELVRKGFNITAWFWEQLLENDFCKLNHHMLINAFELADKYGVNLNQNAYVQDAGQREVFHGTASHLLADTKGDLYKLRPIDNCSASYYSLLSSVLDLGLNIDKQNNNRLTARAIADAVEKNHGKGQSIFKILVDKYELKEKLSADSKGKPDRPRKQSA